MKLLLEADADIKTVSEQYPQCFAKPPRNNNILSPPSLELIRALTESVALANVQTADFNTPLNNFLSLLSPTQTIKPEIAWVLAAFGDAFDQQCQG